MQKIVICPKEASQLLGVELRTAQNKFSAIRKAYDLKKHQYVSVKIFCNFTGLDEEETLKALNTPHRRLQ